jgi:hypothetical protein
MRKLKFIITIILIVVLMLSSPSSAYAEVSDNGDMGDMGGEGLGSEPPPEGMTLDELLMAMIEHINSLQLQVNDLSAVIIALLDELNKASTIDYDEDAIERQIAQVVITERFIYQTEYNRGILLRRNGAFLAQQRDLLITQITVERVRLALGETTQESLDSLIRQLAGIEGEIKHNHDSWLVVSAFVNIRADRRNYEFIQRYQIPEALPLFSHSSARLASDLIANNATLNANMSQQTRLQERLDELRNGSDEERDSTTALELEIEHLSVSISLFEQQLRIAALSKYNSYTEALARYEIYLAQRPALDTRLELLERLLEAGELSRLEYMNLRFAVYEELYRADVAAITLMNLVAELEFMSLGIVG